MFNLLSNKTICLVLLVISCILGFQIREEILQKKPIILEKATPGLPIFDSTNITAKAFLVYDIDTRTILFEKNSSLVLPIASITKLFTISTFLDQSKTFPETTRITIAKDDVSPTHDYGLFEGDNLRTDDLIKTIVVASSNDAMQALARTFEENYSISLVDTTNQYMQGLGIINTTFTDVAGLDNKNLTTGLLKASNKSTLIDIARIVEHIYQGIFLDTFSYSSHRNVTVPVQKSNGKIELLFYDNTNILTPYIPNLLLSKTGYTAIAGGALVILYREPINNHAIIIGVLGSTRGARYSDIFRLYMESRLENQKNK